MIRETNTSPGFVAVRKMCASAASASGEGNRLARNSSNSLPTRATLESAAGFLMGTLPLERRRHHMVADEKDGKLFEFERDLIGTIVTHTVEHLDGAIEVSRFGSLSD